MARLQRLTSWLARARSSVRLRVTLLAAGAFAITFFAAAALLLRNLENGLVDDIRQADESTLAVQAMRVTSLGLPPGAHFVEASGGVPTMQWTDGDEIFISFMPAGATADDFDAAITATGGSATLAARPPPEAVASILGIRENIVASTRPVGGATLATLSSLDDVRDTLNTTTRLLWLFGPALVALVAGLAWVLAGRALRPVRLLTSRVSEIESHSLHERVPEPASSDEIAVLARTMNEMLGRLDTANESSKRLVSDASHELRTPIAVMRTELEVAARADGVSHGSNDWAETTCVLFGELDRLQFLVDDLLLLARGDERAFAQDDVDVVDLAHTVAARRRRPDVDVSVDTDPAREGEPVGANVLTGEPITIAGDRAALERALDHLVANATRSASSRVAVSIERDGDRIAIHVDDDGPGIALDQRDVVVRRFVRLDEGRSRDAGGAGLGLAVASDVAAAHGGRLDITDSPLGGARVTIVLSPARPET
jgi:signal transduction histidine kinase